MLFPWQQQDWQRLNAERARLPNAWLFIGPAGTGKLEFALHLAQSLLCEQLQADHQPCGQCEGCRWFEHGTHPDFRRLSPQTEEEEEGKEAKPGRKLPLIKIEAVRQVIEFAHLTAHRAGQRIVVVEPAENLNPAAANALLKILEEPPQDVLFLLVAQAAQRLLPTIRSRCRQFPLSAPSPAQALDWLRQQGVSNAEAELAHNGARRCSTMTRCWPSCAASLSMAWANPRLPASSIWPSWWTSRSCRWPFRWAGWANGCTIWLV
ncbi:DNA polymerase III subunit delta' [Aquitalea magnusonii]|uniref:DNA polymerase III subunit delta' n=1 Tax=Aquitalea magnusonii TaxID=332411 RepID=UPI000A49B594|nr:DNA polymerase III subunit delta' [Aquitalea magnusonii]